MMMRGGALIRQEQWEAGLSQICESLEVKEIEAVEIMRTIYLSWLARGYSVAGQVEEGLTTVAEALRLAEKIGEILYEAELYRLKGELTLQIGARDLGLETSPPSAQASSLKPLVSSGAERETEACFRKAIDIAQKQHAKSLELRAATSLARLWQQQAKRTEAHQLLANVYNWFTEGFDTKDLQEAKALLIQLA
jgi:predicted ATPase